MAELWILKLANAIARKSLAGRLATNWSAHQKTPGFAAPPGTRAIAGGSSRPNSNALTCATFVRSDK